MKTIIKLFMCALVLLSAEEVFAIGRVYARIPNNVNSPIYNLRIKSLRANITIQDQLAVTHVDQEFANDNYIRLEGFYVFQLPEGAQVNEMYLWINGIRVPYVIKKKQDAIVIYQDIVTRMADPALLEQLGSNLFKLRIFPFEARNTRRIEIVYSQPLTYYKGSIQYTFPLDMTDYSSDPIEIVSLKTNFKSQLAFLNVETSVDQYPAAVSTTKINDYNYTIEYGVERVAFAKDFRIKANIDRAGKSMLALTYSAPDSLNEKPYFIHWTAIPDSITSDSVRSRELTFVADISGSMEGERLMQLKDALISFVDFLTEQDKFNIICFSTGTIQFKPDLVSVTAAIKNEAKIFITQLGALGLTNIEAALRKSLNQSYSDSASTAILFLTDGQPSWGETNIDSLVVYSKRWNTKNIRIFPVGIGEEPDYSLLQRLARENGGIFTKIVAEDSIYLKMKDLYRLLFLPALRNLNVTYSGIGAYELHPVPIPNIFAGDQLMMTGRFTTAGNSTVTLNGTVSSKQYSHSENLFFPDTSRSLNAVARYWGSQKIASLLEMIAQVGELKELVDQVIALSIRYSVLTPYTAFLVVEPATGGTSVKADDLIPNKFRLEQNYPNPFNPMTTITYSYSGNNAKAEYVKLVVYDILGRAIRTLVAEYQSSGTYTMTWDGKDDKGNNVPSGIYVYKLSVGFATISKTMVLMR